MIGRRGSDADTTVEDENSQAYVPKGEKEAEDDHLAPAYGAKYRGTKRADGDSGTGGLLPPFSRS